jgi:putative membrane protein
VTAGHESPGDETNTSDRGEATVVDPSRRTWLAAERTWLAWWRTGLGASAVAIGIGRVLPAFTGGSHLPFKLLGLAYGILAVAILAIGALRQAHVAEALRRGSYDELSSPLVLWLTAGGVGLALATLALIAVAL